jgi:hypothetical protein
MNAASNRGKSLTALVQAVGVNRYLKFLKKKSAKKYSAISTAMTPIAHHIGSSFAFVARSIHSLKSRLLTSASTVVATNFVVPHSRANAGHRGSFVGR